MNHSRKTCRPKDLLLMYGPAAFITAVFAAMVLIDAGFLYDPTVRIPLGPDGKPVQTEAK